MAGALESLVVETAAGALPDVGGSGTGIELNDLPARKPATIFGTSGIKLSGRYRTSARGYVMIFFPSPSYSSCATSSVLLAGQPKRELHNF